MRHTVRRSPGGVEQAGARARTARRGPARTARSGVAPGAAPVPFAPGTTRISPKVPERRPDSGR
ncbi:hypothetical protein ELQ87_21940 [Streptomyces griseoviridis]|uniref:Uncharacterized protein n=1 Tax=Streptomyces griseoviridis TaxID=45398 RepID=A0A3Q9KUZ2_STRGD|nr:hypothetical protein ELQ87_21940 [Streptomyces griseoviridis]QCN86518.1 hypothetical protein DDJ31_17330 [Streptomyces griseoviridis]